jgi:virulence factor Mce-like protein
MALQPSQAKLIPDNVKARMLPKTLFGEKYIALELPQDPASSTLRDGDSVQPDRSAVAIETQQALNDLMPVLQAVQPQKLAATLTAVEKALHGRGKQLGDTLKHLGQYVGKLNPHLPALEHDLSTLAKVSQTYSDAVPHLANALDDLVTTSRTLAEQRANLSKLFGTLNTTADDLRGFLSANEQNLISLVGTSRETLHLLARYSPEFPCVFSGFAGAIPKLDKAWGKGTNQPGLHATLEITVNRGPYKPGRDTPRYNDNRGPRCYDLKNPPFPFPQYPPDGPIKDGSSTGPAPRSQADGAVPAENGPRSATSPQSASAGGTSNATSSALGLANSPSERQFIQQMMAPVLGTSPDGVPGYSSVVLGPLLRGSEVSLR